MSSELKIALEEFCDLMDTVLEDQDDVLCESQDVAAALLGRYVRLRDAAQLTQIV